jgi:hypothetical protein
MNLEVQIAEVRTGQQAGFLAINRRFDDLQTSTQALHEENVERLERIDADVRKTNGRVTKLEVRDGGVTLANLKWYITIFVAGATLAIWAMVTLGGFHR